NASDSQHSAKTRASISLLKDAHGIVIAIYDNSHQLDLLSLKRLVERPELRFMSIHELEEVLSSLKNVSKITSSQIQFIIDEAMSNEDTVFFISDNPAEYIQADIWGMQLTIENALIGGIFSHVTNPVPFAKNMKSNLLEQLKNIEHLPALPAIAADLLALQANPDGTVDDMVRIISHDPALTAQTLRYANSALFGFSGQISNLHDAIFRVLGYETVLYMSFGAALGRAFNLPHSGRLGMNTFWKEATYRAALCQQLASRMPSHFRPPASIAYITGLLHNIGIVLMGNLFQTEFDWLNKMLTSRPEQSLIETEKNLFSCTHPTIGKHLMEHWNMPVEIITVVGEHHTNNYNGDQATYVWLTQLSGQVLSAYGLSDSDKDTAMIETLCHQLELTLEDVSSAVSAVLEENKALDAMAETLCA
ncbi:MAG: HDOD domain-containing protein, partial [Gammaproteobacteria bacterium]|nr:HDOD domain-containing protein [Gammaproteobacteria bacterium]